jgi:hypothetical protein
VPALARILVEARKLRVVRRLDQVLIVLMQKTSLSGVIITHGIAAKWMIERLPVARCKRPAFHA